ncbi:MAG: sarcosine oxidase subunit delta [Alphaproteobacteria bacterium]|nr:sarcosine oxidase subunit delta [Alphaproteobacteria bacterium]
MRRNDKGVYFERWRHSHGCGQWFNVARSTVSNEILAVYRVGDDKPKVTP